MNINRKAIYTRFLLETQQGKEKGERADQSDDLPEGFGTILPGDAPLFGAAQL